MSQFCVVNRRTSLREDRQLQQLKYNLAVSSRVFSLILVDMDRAVCPAFNL